MIVVDVITDNSHNHFGCKTALSLKQVLGDKFGERVRQTLSEERTALCCPQTQNPSCPNSHEITSLNDVIYKFKQKTDAGEGLKTGQRRHRRYTRTFIHSPWPRRTQNNPGDEPRSARWQERLGMKWAFVPQTAGPGLRWEGWGDSLPNVICCP